MQTSVHDPSGRSSLTKVIESPRGKEGNAVKGETLMSPYKFATFIVINNRK